MPRQQNHGNQSERKSFVIVIKQKSFDLMIKSGFDSGVMVTFQIAFRVKIHVNDIFLFFKNYF
jgi:hypothetical protein